MPPERKSVQTAARKRATPAPRGARGAAKDTASEPELLDESMNEPQIPPIAPEPASKNEDRFTFKATHFYAVLVVLAFAAGILIGYAAWGRTPQTVVVQQPAAAQEAAAVPSATPQYVRYKIPTDGFPSLGPADAPITLVEFADFQCPFCRQWEQETYKALLDAYPGKIRIVYRDFPLTSIHPDAMPAAEAAQCADEQGKFWDYHDKLFSSDLNDAFSNSGVTEDSYKTIAQGLGLDMTKFSDCLSTHKYQKSIEDDESFATNLGINSTPTFFINGLAVIGAQPLSTFQNVIDKELAGQIP
jgi:protein-disulfide isomerase